MVMMLKASVPVLAMVSEGWGMQSLSTQSFVVIILIVIVLVVIIIIMVIITPSPATYPVSTMG